MADICEEFWKSLYLEDYEDNCEIVVETDLLKTLKVEYDLLKEHSGRWLHFVAVDYPELKESLSPQKLMELKEKAEKYDEEQELTSREEYERLLQIQTNLVNKHYNERLGTEAKLETVKTHLDTIVIPSVSDITYLKNLLVTEARAHG